MSDLPEQLEKTIRESAEKFMEQAIEALKSGIGTPGFPLSLMFLASTQDEKASRFTMLSPCTTTAPGKPDGWAQALYLSRDLLRVMLTLNDDYNLGLGGLALVAAQHPLIEHVKADVVELVCDGATATGGTGRVH